jgi:beta-glucosidase
MSRTARSDTARLLHAAAAALLGSVAVPALAQAVPPACPVPASGEVRPWLDAKYSAGCRAEFLVRSLPSLEEKLAILVAPGRGGDWLKTRGLPQLRGADGPAGIRGSLGVTAFPSPLTIAASFDTATAAAYGDLLGSEFFDAGFNRMGGPALDVSRTWNFGRTTESLGEDPYLIGQIAAAEVRAIQSHHVLSMVKHFAVYTQEQGRAGDHPLRTKPSVNAIVSERVMREIYFPGFEAAIREGGAGQVMCAFPRINGTYACENPFTLGVLKKEWGFDGMVVPDFPDGQRSIVAAVNAGLDSGMFVGAPAAAAAPGAGALATTTDNSFAGEDIRAAVREGKIRPERIDDMLRRRVAAEFRIGTFDHPAVRKADDVSTEARRAAAVDIVTAAAVLLKNKDAILPLGAAVRTVAVIGAQAGADPVVAEMGSAYVTPSHVAHVLPALRARAPAGTTIRYAPGTLGLDRLPRAPASMFRTPDGGGGLRADYVANANLDFSGKPFLSRIEDGVNQESVPTDPAFPGNKQWSARWRGKFVPTETGVQKFTVAGSGTAELLIGGRPMGRYANSDFGDTIYANVAMTAGVATDIEVRWTPRVTFRDAAVDAYGTTLGPVVRLGWARPDGLIAEAAAAAAKADVAIVFAAHRVGEGMDRQSLALPNDQEALIAAVAAANPHTVVVLQTGGPVTMPWLDKVAGVLETWLPGDAIGPASARLLFGDADPGGRLPVTFPADEAQGPARKPSQYPGTLDPKTGAINDAHFDEGLLVGYRYWDAKGQAPLFPFGHGLSYSTYEISREGERATPDGGATIDVLVRNTGTRPGTEVVQVYVGFPKAAGEPPKQLKGFQKVALRPGQATRVQVKLGARAFQYWDSAQRRWRRMAGTYQLMVGRSSRDILYTAPMRLQSD